MPEQGGGSELTRYRGAAVCCARLYTFIRPLKSLTVSFHPYPTSLLRKPCRSLARICTRPLANDSHSKHHPSPPPSPSPATQTLKKPQLTINSHKRPIHFPQPLQTILQSLRDIMHPPQPRLLPHYNIHLHPHPVPRMIRRNRLVRLDDGRKPPRQVRHLLQNPIVDGGACQAGHVLE